MRAIRLCLSAVLLLLSTLPCQAEDTLLNAGEFAYNRRVVRGQNVFECRITSVVRWEGYEGTFEVEGPVGGRRALMYDEAGDVVRWFGDVVFGFKRTQEGEGGNDIVLSRGEASINIRVWQDRLPFVAYWGAGEIYAGFCKAQY